jgi:predicted metalloprotease with PDZ domain
MRLPILAPAALCAIALTAGEAGPAVAFRLRVPEGNPRRAELEARWVLKDQALSVAGWGAEQFPEGWSKFMRDLRATGPDGRALKLEGNGKGEWKVDAAPGTAVTLTWAVELTHDREAWPHGLDEAAYAKADAVFYTGMALFIAPDDLDTATVRVDLPKGWKASLPWRPVAGQPGLHAAGSYDELVSNGLMLGTHAERVFQEGDFRVTLAVGGALKPSMPQLEQVMKPHLAAYTRIFAAVPRADYLVTLHEGLSDGGAFASSYSLLSSEPLSDANRIDWGHTVAHETFHLWNGTGMAPKVQMDWFKEGFTDYFAILTMARLGLMDECLLTKKLESHARRTFERAPGVTLAEAGKQKKQNWGFIYGGGAMAALCLDARIRAASGGARGLEDMMRALFRDFGPGRRYELKDLVAAASAAAGTDQSDFFARFVQGAEPLPLAEALRGLGFVLVRTTQGEVFISPMAAPDAAQAAAKAAWLRGR